MCPQNKKGGRVAHISPPATSGTQDAGKPSANGGGPKGGVQGAQAPSQGVWGMCPQKRRGELPTLATPPRVGPNTPANPQPTGVGKRGWRGRKPPPRGFGGCAPKIKKGGELPTLATRPRVGPKTLANPRPTGVGKWGVEGAQAPSQGVWGMCPQKFKRRGELPTLATPPTSGAKYTGKPSANGGGQKGVEGAQAPWTSETGPISER